MTEEWKHAFSKTAHAYWTDERIAELTGGKDLWVTPANAPELLRTLGLLHRDASMPPRERRKFFQLNHMLWLLGPPIRELMAERPILHIVDAGCGRSYMTLALAWCFEHVFEHPVRMLGIDRRHELIESCRHQTQMVGLEHLLRYAVADLDDVALDQCWSTAFDEPLDLSAVIALHACDTATDDAISLGVDHRAALIAVAPCCQAELAAQWSELAQSNAPGSFAAVWNVPHLRRETAATITDTFRTLLLRIAGYDTRAVEFVPSEHTPKNTLIRAIYRGEENPQALEEYRALRVVVGDVGIKLERAFGLP